jgi:hypothetical protein
MCTYKLVVHMCFTTNLVENVYAYLQVGGTHVFYHQLGGKRVCVPTTWWKTSVLPPTWRKTCMRTYYLVENTLFTTDLAENRVLFTSATSFTPKKRALLSSSAGAE